MSRIALVLLAVAAGAASAQPAPLVQDSQPLDPRNNQKIERIRVEDSAVKIDETRYAGQTESITVQPKDGLPAYEIVPENAARRSAGDSRRGSTGGDRVWNLLRF